MANTYSQIYVHLVFAVKGRQNLISSVFKEELYKYISGIIKNKKQKLYIINGMPDHVHMLISISPDISISELVREIKSNTSKFINQKHLSVGKFEWQVGFGAFSYSQSQINQIVNYIKQQEEHHRKRSFREEYIELLKKFEIEYDDKYIFS